MEVLAISANAYYWGMSRRYAPAPIHRAERSFFQKFITDGPRKIRVDIRGCRTGDGVPYPT
jgi:hypothetical protein